MAFKEVDIKSLTFNPFTKIGSEWMLITAGDQSGYNTMTASWGGLGVLWGKNVATCYIRPQRYTKKFVDANDTFVALRTKRKIFSYKIQKTLLKRNLKKDA